MAAMSPFFAAEHISDGYSEDLICFISASEDARMAAATVDKNVELDKLRRPKSG